MTTKHTRAAAILSCWLAATATPGQAQTNQGFDGRPWSVSSGNLSVTFPRRMFSDASCGAAQSFTYEFQQHAADIQNYIPLFTGKAGETRIDGQTDTIAPYTIWSNRLPSPKG